MSLVLALVLAASPATPGRTKDKECVTCHRKATAGAVTQWEQSAHAKGKVSCADCHGTDHDRFDGGVAFVDMKVCGECHQAALAQHTRSRHGLGLHSGWGCTRNQPAGGGPACTFCHENDSQRPVSAVHCALFLKQTVEMRALGCIRCHQVERSCASCHTNHSTDLRVVRDPGVCARCHMGPDHPQWESWETSQHGQLFRSVGPASGPTCQRCHMPEGSHDVSRGITTTQAAVSYPASEASTQRALMVKACSGCHAPGFATRELTRADAVRDQSVALVSQGRAIVEDLYDRGLLDPMPASRPPHPLSGSALETGAQLLYEDTSHAERLLFKMAKYDLAKTYKGAYHQNPDYTHWYGNAELKADLVDLRAEARRLERAGPKATTLDEQLRVLKAKVDRGAITPAEYERAKAKLLETRPLR